MLVVPIVLLGIALAASLPGARMRRLRGGDHRSSLRAMGDAVGRARGTMQAPLPGGAGDAGATPHVRIVDAPKSRKRRQVPKRRRPSTRGRAAAAGDRADAQVVPLAELVRRRAAGAVPTVTDDVSSWGR